MRKGANSAVRCRKINRMSAETATGFLNNRLDIIRIGESVAVAKLAEVLPELVMDDSLYPKRVPRSASLREANIHKQFSFPMLLRC